MHKVPSYGLSQSRSQRNPRSSGIKMFKQIIHRLVQEIERQGRSHFSCWVQSAHIWPVKELLIHLKHLHAQKCHCSKCCGCKTKSCNNRTEKTELHFQLLRFFLTECQDLSGGAAGLLQLILLDLDESGLCHLQMHSQRQNIN